MISFGSDYIAGAHPEILNRLVETNLENLSGYGTDSYSESAKEKIKEYFDCKDSEVFFLVGGTQTNQIVIDTVLNPYEGVVSANTGHINVHEAGAIEFTGKKVFGLSSKDGKISAIDVDKYISDFYADENHEHMVFPGMVYISYPTEYGTLYSKKELSDLHLVCKKYNIPLYIDGARLCYGLASDECDIDIKEFSKLCDIFYIGGTKAGLLCGEAVVFNNGAPKHFITQIKQHGGLLAKGRVLGIQFDAMFTNDLFGKIGEHGIAKANKLKDLFKAKGYEFFIDSPTNQQFIVLDDANMERLSENVVFSFWEKCGINKSVVRFATSFSTTDDDMEKLADLL